MSQRQNFVDNRYVGSRGSGSFDLVDPATDEIVGQSQAFIEHGVEEAYAAVEAAAVTWGRTTPSARQAAMLEIADAMEARRDDLVVTAGRKAFADDHPSTLSTRKLTP